MNPQWAFIEPYYNDPWVWIEVAVCAAVGIIAIELCNTKR